MDKFLCLHPFTQKSDSLQEKQPVTVHLRGLIDIEGEGSKYYLRFLLFLN